MDRRLACPVQLFQLDTGQERRPSHQAKGGVTTNGKATVNSRARRGRDTVPQLIEYTEKVVYGEVWERPGLSKRDRSLVTVSALIAMYRGDQLKGHLQRALFNGVTKDELAEVITHMAFYSGWPTSMTAARLLKEVLDEI